MTRYLKIIILLSFIFPIKTLANQVIDIDSHELDIPVSIGYTGNKIHIYGATNIQGTVVVKIKGKNTQYNINKKVKKNVFWVDKQIGSIKNIPSVYMITSNKQILPETLKKLNIGFNSINPKIDNNINSYENQKIWKKVIGIQNKRSNYTYQPNNIQKKNHLFKASFDLPQSINIGDYQVSAFVIKENGNMSKIATENISIKRSGIISFVYSTARDYPNIYGVIVVMLSLLIGFLAGYRKN